MTRLERLLIPTLAAMACAAATQAPRIPTDSINRNEPVIQIRTARLSAAPGHVRMQSAANGAIVYVSQRSIVDDEHIVRAQAYRRSGNLAIEVFFTPDGAARLREATRASVGEHMAVLIAGQLTTAAPVMNPLSLPDGRVTIGIQLNDRTAAEFAALIAAKWPLPPPLPGQKD